MKTECIKMLEVFDKDELLFIIQEYDRYCEEFKADKLNNGYKPLCVTEYIKEGDLIEVLKNMQYYASTINEEIISDKILVKLQNMTMADGGIW